MENLIILAVVAVIVTLSGRYLYRAKKRGVKCIGCPSGCSCNGKCGEHSNQADAPDCDR